MLLFQQPEQANPLILLRLQQATPFRKLDELTDEDAGRISRCLFSFRERCDGTLQSHKPVVGHHQLQLLLGGCPHHQNTKYLRLHWLMLATFREREALDNYSNVDCFFIYPNTCTLNIYH